MNQPPDPAQVATRMVQELWNERRLEVADELFPADFDNGADRPRGPDGVKQWHCETATAFPDLHYVVARNTRP